jgi:tRNA nucleotidyltransferase/poly(A) polymerase
MAMDIRDVLAKIPQGDALLAARHEVGIHAWIVGGAVRDLLLQRTPCDVDVTCAQPEALARTFAAKLNAHVVPMDVERGIWRVAIARAAYMDFCAFRDSDIVGDLRGRDFTFNAIALELPSADAPDSKGVLDPFHGIEDLDAGVLRMVDPRAFADDPARVMRAFRFLAELPLTIEEDTWDALVAVAPRLLGVARERVLVELWKLCAGARAAHAIQRMDEAGVLGRLIPKIEEAKGVTQNAYHHLDVWHHLLLAVTNMARILHHPEEELQQYVGAFGPVLDDAHRRARLVFLALIHDIAKPATRTVKAGRVHFYGHDEVGAQMVADIARQFGMSNDDTRALTTVVRHHLRPLFMMQSLQRGQLSRKAMGKFYDDVGPYALEVLLLAMADKMAGRGPLAEPDIQRQMRDLYGQLFTFYDTVYRLIQEHPLVTGHDLIAELGIPPGSEVGRLLREIRTRQVLGALSTRDEALRWARRQHNRQS